MFLNFFFIDCFVFVACRWISFKAKTIGAYGSSFLKEERKKLKLIGIGLGMALALVEAIGRNNGETVSFFLVPFQLLPQDFLILRYFP